MCLSVEKRGSDGTKHALTNTCADQHYYSYREMGHPRNSAPERNDIIITASIIINISVIIISSSSSMTKCNSIICIIISSSIDLRMLSLLVSYPRSSARMG